MTASSLPLSTDRPRFADGRLDWLWVLILGLLLRLALFNGAFGSDDVTYFQRAWDVARGDWSSAQYNGALRYGFNLPAGALMYLFGHSVAAANLWSLLCSLSELVAVYGLARSAFGRTAALYAGLLLACTPLQVAVATRIHADPIVSAALTWGFVGLYHGLRLDSPRLLFGAGLAMGFVYWAKELAAVCYFAYLPLLYFFRRTPSRVLSVLAGVLLMLMLNGLLMIWIAGDPLHPIKVVLGALQRNFVQGGDGRDEAWYYLPLLFVDLRHVGLLGWLSLLGLVALWRRPPPQQQAQQPSVRLFLTLWAAGLLLVLSCFPVSLAPLRFTLKQSNYLSLLLAPLAVLAGALLAQWPARRARWVMALAALLGIALAALQQADYRAFTANSKAVAAFAAAHPQDLVLGSTNNASLATMLGRQAGQPLQVLSWREARGEPALLSEALRRSGAVYGVHDPQTAAWFAGAAAPSQVPACWQRVETLQPVELGAGNLLAGGLARLAAAVPGLAPAAPRLAALAQPQAASLYRVPKDDPWCEAGR